MMHVLVPVAFVAAAATVVGWQLVPRAARTARTIGSARIIGSVGGVGPIGPLRRTAPRRRRCAGRPVDEASGAGASRRRGRPARWATRHDARGPLSSMRPAPAG